MNYFYSSALENRAYSQQGCNMHLKICKEGISHIKFLSQHMHIHTNTHTQKETFGGDKYAYYIDCGDGFMGICICPNP